jgi:hypothetical protein
MWLWRIQNPDVRDRVLSLSFLLRSFVCFSGCVPQFCLLLCQPKSVCRQKTDVTRIERSILQSSPHSTAASWPLMLVWGVVRPRSGRIISHSSLLLPAVERSTSALNFAPRKQTAKNKKAGTCIAGLCCGCFVHCHLDLGSASTLSHPIHRQPLIRRRRHITFTSETKGIKRDAIFGRIPDANLVFTTFARLLLTTGSVLAF